MRRYDARSALDEFSPGDTLSVKGVMSGTTLMVSWIKDLSIQHAFTRNLGVITSISTDMSRLTVRVLRDGVFKGRNPFAIGQTIFLNVTPTMSVTLADGSRGTMRDNLGPGMAIVTLGVFNRNSKTLDTVDRVRVLSPQAGQTTEVHGILQAGFAATAPATLTIRTLYHGLVTIAVDSSTTILRRYNGASGLDELNAGDSLGLVAVWHGGTVYGAKLVKDFSIQKAFTWSEGTITALSVMAPTGSITPTTTITIVVLAGGGRLRVNPFRAGQTVTLNVTTTTTVLLATGTVGTALSLRTGMQISALGLVDRKSLSYTQVARIRVIK